MLPSTRHPHSNPPKRTPKPKNTELWQETNEKGFVLFFLNPFHSTTCGSNPQDQSHVYLFWDYPQNPMYFPSPRKHTQLLMKLWLPPLTPINHPATGKRMPANSLGAQLVFLRNMLLPPVTQERKQAEPAWVLPKLSTPAQQPDNTSAVLPGWFNQEDRLLNYACSNSYINYLWTLWTISYALCLHRERK